MLYEVITGMNDLQARNWVAAAVDTLRIQGSLEAAVVVVRREKEFTEAAQKFSRLPIFGDLPKKELEAIVSRIFFKEYQRGDTFFHQLEPADRMYIVEHGEVALIDPRSKSQSTQTVRDNQRNNFV